MNNTQVIGMRQMHEAMNTTADREEKTTVEMALTSHKLNRAGDIATLRDGTRFYWNQQASMWVR